jgi:thiamine phosphate synthase YjbQ (UPF0047 family)
MLISNRPSSVRSVTVPFENGKLLLGRWQAIYMCEFDGPRERKVIVSMMAETRQ